MVDQQNSSGLGYVTIVLLQAQQAYPVTVTSCHQSPVYHQFLGVVHAILHGKTL